MSWESKVAVTRGQQGRRILKRPTCFSALVQHKEKKRVLQKCPAAAVCPQAIPPRQDISAQAQGHSNLMVERKHVGTWCISEQQMNGCKNSEFLCQVVFAPLLVCVCDISQSVQCLLPMPPCHLISTPFLGLAVSKKWDSWEEKFDSRHGAGLLEGACGRYYTDKRAAFLHWTTDRVTSPGAPVVHHFQCG